MIPTVCTVRQRRSAKKPGMFLVLTWQAASTRRKNLMITGRSGRIRTCDPCVPNAVLYRAEPHSDKNAAYSLGFRTPQEAELRMPIPVNVGLTTPILPANEAAVAAAARCLAEGGLVGFPTETVYGLGADATNPAAIARLYEAKGRPAFNPLIAHVGGLEAARRIGRF